MYDFQSLKVYQASKDNALTIFKLSQRIRNYDIWLASQIKRAGFGIALNIAEGTGRTSYADKSHFYVMTRGSTYECVALIEILKEINLISNEEYMMLIKKFDEISKMLFSLIKSTRNRIK